MADEQNDKTEELSAGNLAQVTGGTTFSTLEPIKLKEPLPITKAGPSGPVIWDIAQNKSS